MNVLNASLRFYVRLYEGVDNIPKEETPLEGAPDDEKDLQATYFVEKEVDLPIVPVAGMYVSEDIFDYWSYEAELKVEKVTYSIDHNWLTVYLSDVLLSGREEKSTTDVWREVKKHLEEGGWNVEFESCEDTWVE